LVDDSTQKWNWEQMSSERQWYEHKDNEEEEMSKRDVNLSEHQE